MAVARSESFSSTDFISDVDFFVCETIKEYFNGKLLSFAGGILPLKTIVPL